MNCIFCYQLMRKEYTLGNDRRVGYFCLNKNCQIKHMCRYAVSFIGPDIYSPKESESILFEDLYLIFDYLGDKTTISRIKEIIITEQIVINKIVQVDRNNPQKMYERLNFLLIYS